MSWWKQDYAYLLIKILCFIGILSCGKVYSLPQDWTCQPIIVKKIAENQINETTIQYQYKGVSDLYQLNIDINYIQSYPTRLDDCGTQGCTGLIKNVQTDKTEYLNFYCEPTSNKNFDTLKCTIHSDLEYLFSKKNNTAYTAQPCADILHSFYQLELNNCHKCKCNIDYYKQNEKQNSNTILNCTKENEKTIRCFTAEGYILKYGLKNTLEDYNNCIGLNL